MNALLYVCNYFDSPEAAYVAKTPTGVKRTDNHVGGLGLADTAG